MSETPMLRCPRCGGALPNETDRLCPACLLAIAAESSGADSPTMTAFGSGSEPSAPGAPQLQRGQIFGAYRIERLLGKGGMGEVYEAEQLEHGRRVALKVLNQRMADPEDRARFLREGQLAASVNHPNSVYIFGSEEIAGAPVITMELLAGGTLKDVVERDGPMEPAKAVDAILQVIAGLDGAHQGGILHRDVKPSNCFLDLDGTVKIGDFGLSIPTLATYGDGLIEHGSIQGTPQFAAPEQLKGEPLDVRADIYAVGGTLYYLLSGHPAFDSADLAVLLDHVQHRPATVPKRLRGPIAAIVLSCLAKEPSRRPQDYRELHDALSPFSSAAATPAGLGARAVAITIDALIVGVVVALIGNLLDTAWQRLAFGAAANAAEARAHAERAIWFVQNRARWGALMLFAMTAVYFAIFESIGSASIGKMILRLKLSGDAGGRPRPAAGLGRTLIFIAPGTLLQLLLGNGAGVWIPALFLLGTARRHNGFAGIHELLSGTSVTRRPAARQWRVASVTAPERHPAVSRAFGVFAAVHEIVRSGGVTVHEGVDRVLRRPVWIVESPAGAPLAPIETREIARLTRVRWLAGRATASGTWQAYEAPPGRPLLAAIEQQPPWLVVRQWLADITAELAASLRGGRLPALALDRVWITRDGRAKLSDFPVTSAAPSEPDGLSPSASPATEAARFAVRVANAARGGPHALPPIRLADARTLRELATSATSGVADVEHAQAVFREAPAPVDRWARAILPATFLLICIAYVSDGLSDRPRRSGIVEDRRALYNGLARIEGMRRAGVAASDPRREALETYIAARYRGELSRATWSDHRLAELYDVGADVARRHPGVGDAELVEAAVRLDRTDGTILDRLNTQQPMRSAPAFVLGPFVGSFAAMGLVCAAFSAAAFREGAILRVLHLVIVDRDGLPVTRLRATARACLAWGPLGLYYLLPRPASVAFGNHVGLWSGVTAALFVIALIGAAWAISVPARGLHDRIAGTWLVPR